MKNIYMFFIILLCIGCQKDDNVIVELDDLAKDYRLDNAIALEVSSKDIVLDLAKRREQALLVTWEPLKDLETLYPVKYLFKMDLTEKGFTTSLPTEEMQEGVNFKSFTHEQLEGYIRDFWGVKGIDDVFVSVRVIAQIESDVKYVVPITSTMELKIKPFNVESRPLFLYGSALNSSSMLEISEVVPGEIYSFRGNMLKGTFNIALHLDQEFPAYTSGNNGEVISTEENSSSVHSFQIENDGAYAILFDRTNMKIDIQKIPFLNIYFGGSATPTLWTNPPMLTWDVYRPNIGTITTNLVAGELKFSTEPNFSATTLQLRPYKPDASIITDHDVLVSVLRDWKWRISNVTETGRYKVILDIKSMKVQFIKLN